MAAFGKSIRVYLKDGTVTGIKFGEVVNQTIQSISCPRLRIGELLELSESKRPGVYFLFGEDEQTGESKAYIGEAENVYSRLQSHIANKDFWNEVIFFVSKDENLTKSHVKYLESRLVQLAISTKRYLVENQNLPQQSSLPVADRDAMEEFLQYLKLLIGVMGHKILEDVSTPPTSITKDTNGNGNNLATKVINLELFLNMSGLKAKARQTDEGMVVLAGSEAALNTTASLGAGYKELRDKLIQNGTLSLQESCYVFQNDILFNSSSAAGAVVCGYNISGPLNWKSALGKTLKEIESERIEGNLHIQNSQAVFKS